MAALTVFLAPDGPAAGVLDVLADLSAAGFLDPFLWVRESQVASTSSIGATAVSGGLRSQVTVGDILLDQPHDRVRLCVIVPVTCGSPAVPSATEELLYRVAHQNGAMPVSRIRCVVARPGSTASAADVARLGWHNVLIADEEAYGPVGRLSELPASADPVDVGQHAAPMVAGLIGLWQGAAGCALDGPPAGGLRVARAFYRRVDADGVEQELRARVLATGPELPLPKGWGDPVIYLDNPDEACRDMAERLWARHRDKLIGPREQPRLGKPIALSWRTALGWLLRFIGAAMRDWPTDWLRGKGTGHAVRHAKRMQNSLFGSGDSAYTVIVRGMTKDNLPAGWQDVAAASASIDERLAAEELSGRAPVPELTEMWSDYRNGACSLVDAGDRSGMPPRKLSDGRRAILRFADDCVPAPQQRFRHVPSQVAARIGIHAVDVGDVLGTHLLRDRLAHLSRVEPMQAVAAGGALNELAGWENAHARSYSVQVGWRIAEALRRTFAEIGQYLQILGQATEADGSEEHGSRALTIWLRILAVLAVLGLCAGPVLRHYDLINTRAQVIIMVAPAALWLGVAVGGFVNQQRRIFQELNRRTELMSKIEAAQVNLRQAVIDAGRLQNAYEQYLVWSRIVGALLHQPFGPRAQAQAGPPRIARGLPRTTRVAEAQTDIREVGVAAEILRADQYGPGWFGNLWEIHQTDGVARLGLHQLAERPGELTQLQGRRVWDAPLAAWADVLDREGTTRRAGDIEWQARLRSLDGERAALGARLLSSVKPTQDGDGRAVSLEEFLAAVDGSGPVGRGQDFAPVHFGERAQSQGWTEVAAGFPQQSRRGLSRVVTLVQLGRVLEPSELAVAVSGTADAGTAVPDAPPPMPDLPRSWDGPGHSRTEAASTAPTARPTRGFVPPAPDGFA